MQRKEADKDYEDEDDDPDSTQTPGRLLLHYLLATVTVFKSNGSFLGELLDLNSICINISVLLRWKPVKGPFPHLYKVGKTL